MTLLYVFELKWTESSERAEKGSLLLSGRAHTAVDLLIGWLAEETEW
jgi:hypothetical protein